MRAMTFDDLRRILADCAGGTDLFERDAAQGGEPLDEPFEELGYDSLALIESAAWIEREFGVGVPDEVIAEVHTPRALLALVNVESEPESASGASEASGRAAFDISTSDSASVSASAPAAATA